LFPGVVVDFSCH